jgi:hypothetical protein
LDDLTSRVAAFQARINREPCVLADRLWVKDRLDPEEEKLRFSVCRERRKGTPNRSSNCDLDDNRRPGRHRRELWSMLVYGSGGSLLLGSLNGFAVAEAHALNHLGEPLRAIQPTPVPLGRLGKLEDHGERSLARQAAFGLAGA